MEKSMINNKLRSVITLVDRLRDINLQSYIKLPKIVAVGSQSSGKSSLVQQVVGLDFLPRGTGVVTRRPLQIRMTYNHDLKQPYAQFQELPNQKLTDFSEVKKTIGILTEKVCGANKNIVDKAIILNVYSSQCPNLTIIDLPGLTRIAVQGQDKNIHEVTSNMIRKYMQDSNTIILCVISANQDITNDEVLMMARKIDRDGERTIGCITKIDIMDRGTDARDLLLNRSVVQMKLGFFGIKNRSQADINENKTVQDSIEAEKMFFSKSPIYSSLPPACLGTGSLVTTLTKVLSKSITKFLPELVSKIKQRKHQLSQMQPNQLQLSIKQYGRPLPKNAQEKQALTWQLCSQFIREYKKAISGEVTVLKEKEKIQKTSIKIRESLHTILDEEWNINPAENLSDNLILFSMRKFQGSNMPGFPSIHSFMFLLDPLVHKLRSPLAGCLQGVSESMIHLAQLIIADIAHEYIAFREYLVSKTSQVISNFKRQSSQFINSIMQSEINYIYTNNPVFDVLVNRQLTSQEKQSQEAIRNPLIIVLRKRVAAYYKLMVQNLRDLIPKNITHFLIKNAVEKLQFQIFQDSGFGSDKADQWFMLGDSAMKERLNREKQYETIQKAQQFLLTHSGLADIRKGQLQKKRILRQKQMSEPANKKKKIEVSPIRKQQVGNINVHNSIQKSKFPQPQPRSNPSTRPNTGKQQEKVPEAPDKGKNFTQLFGPSAGIKKTQNPPSVSQNQKQQQIPKTKNDMVDTYNKQAGKATDNAVEELYKNEKFQQQSKKAVQNGTSTAAQQQLGVSQSTGNSIGKAAGWLFGQQATQNYLKDETKKQVRTQTQIIPQKK